MRQLALSMVLGSRANYDVLLKYVALIEEFNWVSPAATARGEGSRIYGSIGTEYVLYNPWTNSAITVADANAIREDPPLTPVDHEIGFFFDSHGGDAQREEVHMELADNEGSLSGFA